MSWVKSHDSGIHDQGLNRETSNISTLKYILYSNNSISFCKIELGQISIKE